MFWTCICLLEVAYAGGVGMGLFCQVPLPAGLLLPLSSPALPALGGQLRSQLPAKSEAAVPESAHLPVQIGWRRWAAAAAHAVLGAVLIVRARETDLEQPQELYSCYMFVWKLFYLEYLLLPILR